MPSPLKCRSLGALTFLWAAFSKHVYKPVTSSRLSMNSSQATSEEVQPTISPRSIDNIHAFCELLY